MENVRLAVTGVLALCACAAAAAADREDPPLFALEAGVAGHGTYSVTVGLRWPWRWRGGPNGGWTGATEAFISHWGSQVHGEHEARTVVGALPVFRYRFASGRSDWFAEGGIGVSYMDALYRTDDHQFSTQFNFVNVLGVGRSFGQRHEQELSLRVSHLSNAGIKNPNPGENFVQLRYSHAL